jgi:hypothetical protein
MFIASAGSKLMPHGAFSSPDIMVATNITAINPING